MMNLKGMSTGLVCAALAAGAAAGAFAAEAFPVREAAVVYADRFGSSSGERWAYDAARDLQRVLSLVTGTKLGIYPESKAPKDLKYGIYLGPTAAA